MNLQELCFKAVEVSRQNGADDAEAFGSEELYSGVIAAESGIRFSGVRGREGIAVRVFLKDVEGFRVGFSYTSDLRKETLPEVVSSALAAASIHPRIRGRYQLPSDSKTNSVEDISDPDLISPKPELYAGISDRILEADESRYNCDVSVLVVGGRCNRFVANSAGLGSSFSSTYFFVESHAKAGSGDSKTLSFDSSQSSHIDESSARACVRESREWAVTCLNARKSSLSETTRVVLGPSAVKQLLALTLLPWLRADQSLSGSTVFGSDKSRISIGPQLSVVDDPRRPRAIGSRPFDDEGTVSSIKVLIEKGRFVSFLSDVVTTAQINGTSPGNCYRGGFGTAFLGCPYDTPPVCGPSNFCVVSDETMGLHEIFSELGKGLYIKEFAAIRTRGQFEFLATCFDAMYVADGSIQHAVRGVTIKGYLTNLFQNILSIGSDARQLSIGGHMDISPTIIAPPISFKEISVA